MSAGNLPGANVGGRRGGSSQDFELNLASIIDCFTVLIAFMLATASFLSIGILDAGVAAAGATSTGAPPPDVTLTVELKSDHRIELRLGGKSTKKFEISAAVGENASAAYDLTQLQERLTELKTQWPGLKAVTLQADNSIEYKQVVLAMDSTRKKIPVVLLGGF